jgi:hypothetical protein
MINRYSWILVVILLLTLAVGTVYATSCDEKCFGTAGEPLLVQREKSISTLPVVLTDPIGDSTGPIDAVEIAGGSTEQELLLEITFAPTSTVTESETSILLDLDQNVSTGEPTSNIWFALPTQTIGCENLLSVSAELVEVRTCVFPTTVITTVLPTVGTDSISLSIPLNILGDDGNLNLAVITGGEAGPEDWIPQDGHGTLGMIADFPVYLPFIIRQ